MIRSLAHRWGPVLLWMAGIFYFSSHPHPLGPLSRSQYSELIGRAAHFLEYAGLAVLLYRAVTGSTKGQGASESPGSSNPSDLPLVHNPCVTAARTQPPFGAFAIAFAYAIFDELHQELVPGRGFELTDIGVDLAGIAAALGLIWMRKRGRRSGRAREMG